MLVSGLEYTMAGYGAIETDEKGSEVEAQPPVKASDNFKESDFLFLKDTHISPEERCRKVLLAAIPLIIAVLVMGGIGVWLLKDFDHLYPGPSGSRSPSLPKPRGPSTSIPEDSSPDLSPASDDAPSAVADLKPLGPPISSKDLVPSPTPVSNPKTSPLVSDSSCNAHSSCEKLGLTGVCCPTDKGVMLECCSK